jgi:hypothetical protein
VLLAAPAAGCTAPARQQTKSSHPQLGTLITGRSGMRSCSTSSPAASAAAMTPRGRRQRRAVVIPHTMHWLRLQQACATQQRPLQMCDFRHS